ncbi:MAG TPA: F0F1 ATP synthase subunit epsilon [Geobacteraceae bacterium]|nr:F0F1 ATP synthase subunit epsilon [Geobacteraceae bacterium]
MAEQLKFELVTPQRKVVSEEVDEITAPGTIGEFGVLPGHTPFLSSLKIGELSFKQEGKTKFLAVSKGYFEVVNNLVTVLVDSAEYAEEIDLERAKKAMAKSEEKLKTLAPDDKDFVAMDAALQRALIRMQVAAKAARR